MKYEDLPIEIQEKTVRSVKKDGTFSNYVSLIYKNDTVYGWYNLTDESAVNLLTEYYQREYEPEEYKKKAQLSRDKFTEDRKVKILATAQKIPESEYNGPVFEYDNDGYFYSTEDFKERFVEQFIENYDGDEKYLSKEEHGIMSDENSAEGELEKVALNHLDEFVHPAQPYSPSEISARKLIEDMFAEAESWEEFNYDVKGEGELQAALDKFYELNKNTGYFVPDESKIVMLDKNL